MAIVFPGKTECVLCHLVIQPSDEVVAFPAFLKDTHRLYRYSDSAMHRPCYDACPDKEELHRLFLRFRQIWDSRPKDATEEETEAWGRSAFKEFE